MSRIKEKKVIRRWSERRWEEWKEGDVKGRKVEGRGKGSR